MYTQVTEKNKLVFAGMTVVEKVNSDNINQTAQRSIKGSIVKTDGRPAYNVLTQECMIHKKTIIGDPKNASEILPWVHTLIANCKGTFEELITALVLNTSSTIWQNFVKDLIDALSLNNYLSD